MSVHECFAYLHVNNQPWDGKAAKVCMANQQATLHLQPGADDGLDLQILI